MPAQPPARRHGTHFVCAAGEEVANCPSCSLYVRVIYDPADFQQPAGDVQQAA